MLFSKRIPSRRRSQPNKAAPAVTQLEDRVLLSAVAASVAETTELTTDVTLSDGSSTATSTLASLSSTSINHLDTWPAEDFSHIAVDGDVVLAWNELFGELLTEAGDEETPGHASRAMAMLNLAIYDAVSIASGNADNSFYEYSSVGRYEGVSAEVAAPEAAATVLASLFPEQSATIESFRDAVVAANGGESGHAKAVTLGEIVGSTIVEIRSTDGSDVLGTYEYVEGAGNFQPDPENPDVPAWGPAWADVDTFAIDSTGAFTPDGPPDLDSEEYAASYNEVLDLGAADSETRTAEQTEIGIFWAYDRSGLGTPLALYNDILITVAEQEGNSLEENAALFAQASVAMADAAIVAWDSKFTENFWRPGTAITEGDTDGNPLTEGDPDWIALGAPDGDNDTGGLTPQFPTYISGHATFGGALFGTLQEFYGTDDISFEVHSEELQEIIDNPELAAAYGLESTDATRTFNSFSEASAENGRSRVYLGIHFDFDDIVGQEVGEEIAAAVAGTFEVTTDNDSKSDRKSSDPNKRDDLRYGDRRNDSRDRNRRQVVSHDRAAASPSSQTAKQVHASTRVDESRSRDRTSERSSKSVSLDQFFASTNIADQLDRLLTKQKR